MQKAENPASGSAKANTAILRIAYLIAASDKDVTKEEREVFKKTLCALQGLKMGDDETTELIESVVEDARKFAILRAFYSERELVKAFLSKVSKDVVAIQCSKIDCRKAFAVWTSICMADGEYSDFERTLVKGLQTAINGVSAFEVSAAASLVGNIVAAPALFILGAATKMANMVSKDEARDKPKGFGADTQVPDAFLIEVEERCAEIDDAQAQLANSTSAEERRAIEDSIKCLVDSFKEFIVNI